MIASFNIIACSDAVAFRAERCARTHHQTFQMLACWRFDCSLLGRCLLWTRPSKLQSRVIVSPAAVCAGRSLVRTTHVGWATCAAAGCAAKDVQRKATPADCSQRGRLCIRSRADGTCSQRASPIFEPPPVPDVQQRASSTLSKQSMCYFNSARPASLECAMHALLSCLRPIYIDRQRLVLLPHRQSLCADRCLCGRILCACFTRQNGKPLDPLRASQQSTTVLRYHLPRPIFTLRSCRPKLART